MYLALAWYHLLVVNLWRFFLSLRSSYVRDPIEIEEVVLGFCSCSAFPNVLHSVLVISATHDTVVDAYTWAYTVGVT